MSAAIAYRDAVTTDGPELAAMARRSFTDTFGTLYRQEDLALFLDQAFGSSGLPADLTDPAYRVRVATEDDRIVGYCKIGPVTFPGDWPDSAMELHQLYILADHHGAGLAPVLMDWALDAMRTQGASEVVLSVFVDNHRARRFYERYGFEEIGRYVFKVGDHEDDDRLMRLTL
ncbi:MAG: GNAT family N-acetyltransferase [Sphingomonas sp.]|uniref:GNAT family N-acetyltransferase n=1 Tax=Sphingomonas sp. TaxID=28214 RepID=UPI003F81674E